MRPRHTLLVLLLVLAHSLFADQGSHPNNPLFKEVNCKLFNYQGPIMYFAEVGGGCMKSGDFEGIELSSNIGTQFGQTLNHALSFEYIYADLHTQSCFAPTSTFPGIASSELRAAGKCRLKEYMTILNYRFGGSIGKSIKIPFYIGAGAGLNVMEYDDYSLRVSVSSTGRTQRRIQKKSTLEPEPAGQVFAGIGIQITERLSIMLRGRVLFTKTEKVRLGNMTGLKVVACSKNTQYAGELVFSIIL